jgi:hypothetical protein
MKKIAILALLLAMTGCATQRFDLHPASQDAAAFDDAQTFWVFGIGQKEEIDAAKVCGVGKVQRVETQMTAANVAVTFMTIGIYSPRQVRVYCKR